MRESALHQHIYRQNDQLSDLVRIPPGDDMGAISVDAALLLAAVDQVVDGVHVNVAATPLDRIGWKAMARCVSDVAAMAARPVASLVAAVLPPDFTESRATELFDAMRAHAATLGAPLIGGDIAVHRHDGPLTLSVTVLATPGPTPPVQRGGVRAGDAIYVTGQVGGSYDRTSGGGRHLSFTPRVAEALALAETLGDDLHAMIDLSDGLARDAKRLADAADVRIELDITRLPLSDGCDWKAGVGDGEDYELCFAVPMDASPPTLDTPITRIGRADAGPPGLDFVDAGGERVADDTSDWGWDHRGNATG